MLLLSCSNCSSKKASARVSQLYAEQQTRGSQAAPCFSAHLRRKRPDLRSSSAAFNS